MSADAVIVDGQNVDKGALRGLLAGYEAQLAQDLSAIQTHTTNLTTLNTQIASDEARLGVHDSAVSALQAAIASANSLIQSNINSIAANGIHLHEHGITLADIQSALATAQAQLSTAQQALATNTAAIGPLQASAATAATELATLTANVTALQASLAAAEASFVSLSGIITGQESSGMGPMVPVPYPGLNLSGASFATDSPFSGGGKCLSAGYGQPFVSPIAALPYSVSARVKTSTGTGTRAAAGQVNMFLLGCSSTGQAFAQFATKSGMASVNSSVQVADGNWHAIELVVSVSGAILFVDGVAAGTSDLPGYVSYALETESGSQILTEAGTPILLPEPFGIRDVGGNQGVTPWSGLVCEVAVWPVAKHTTNYTLQTAPFTGNEGMSALYHLNGDGSDVIGGPSVQIGIRPAVASGIRFFMQPGDSVTYTIQPVGSDLSSPSPYQVTIAGTSNPEWYEPFTANLMLFMTGIAGAPLCRWLALPIIGQGGSDPSNLAMTTTTTTDATPTVVDTILITGQPGAAANVQGIIMARNVATGDVCSFSVAAVVKNLDTSTTTVDQQSVTAFSPPASMAGLSLVVGAFGSTITLTATGLAGTQILWKPNLQTMVA